MNIEEFLSNNGYNIRHDGVQCSIENIVWVAYKRLDGAKFCICNDKAPQISVKYSKFLIPNSDKYHESYEVDVVGETNIDWLNYSFYALSADGLIEKLSKIEDTLIRAWNTSWLEESTNTMFVCKHHTFYSHYEKEVESIAFLTFNKDEAIKWCDSFDVVIENGETCEWRTCTEVKLDHEYTTLNKNTLSDERCIIDYPKNTYSTYVDQH